MLQWCAGAVAGGHVGSEHGEGKLRDVVAQRLAAFVVFMVAGRGGVPGHERVELGQHGPAVHAEKQRALEAVARVQREHAVGVLRLHALDFGGHARVAAGAFDVADAVDALVAPAGDVGVRVIGVRDDQIGVGDGALGGRAGRAGAARQQRGGKGKGGVFHGADCLGF